MKLRIKLTVQPAVTHRVEAPNDATLGDLQQIVVSSIPPLHGLAAEAIKLSLNNKVPISDDSTTQLRHVGVCSGDAVWVLNSAAVPSVAAATNQGQAGAGASAEVNKRQRPDNSLQRHEDLQMASTAPNTAQPLNTDMDVDQQGLATTSSPVAEMPTAASTAGSIEAGGSTAAAAAAAEAQDAEDAQAELLPQHVAEHKGSLPPGPVTLLRVLSSWQQLNNGQLAAVSQPDQQTGQQPAASPHQLLLLAVHAAMQEAGFSLTATPAAAAAAATTATTSSSAAAAATAAGPVPTRLQHLCLPPHSPAFLRYTYSSSITEQGAAPVCSLRALSMGPHLVVHASVAQQGQAPAAAVKNAGGSGTTTTTATPAVAASITLDTRTELLADVVKQPFSSSNALGAFTHLKALWIRLQDSLVSPCINMVFRAQGLDPPRGLMYLPFELKDVILKQLKAIDLARLSSTCVELRHLASENRLWEPLFNKEFPFVSLAVRNAAALHGFKAAYAAAWKARKERSLRRAPIYPLMPPPMPSPWNPFIPPAPTFPHNIIGGDYDRLPALPGHMGIGTGPLGGMFSGPVFGAGRLQPRQGGVQGPGGLFGAGRGGRHGTGHGMWG